MLVSEPPELVIRRPQIQGSNTAVILDNCLFLKGYWRLRWGTNPELEIGRFLTDVSPFPHIIPVIGALEYRSGDGHVATLALLQSFADNQGDAWCYTLEYLHRFLEQCAASHVSWPAS